MTTRAVELEPWHPAMPHADLAADVRWWVGCPLGFGLFGRLALDQVAYRPVAAAVDRSGRFRENFTNRGLRSYAYGMASAFSDPADCRRDVEELKRLHGQVRGQGAGDFADTRYSALTPQLWKWIAVSGLNVGYQGYVAMRGNLDDDEKEVVYQTLRWITQDLELRSEDAKLPQTLADMRAYYETVAAEELADNSFLQYANSAFGDLPAPTVRVPRKLRPVVNVLWKPLSPLALRAPKVLGKTLAHPKMLEILGNKVTRRDRIESAMYLASIRWAWQHLPRWIMLDPLAYNRFRYEQLRSSYLKVQLKSFAV